MLRTELQAVQSQSSQAEQESARLRTLLDERQKELAAAKQDVARLSVEVRCERKIVADDADTHAECATSR